MTFCTTVTIPSAAVLNIPLVLIASERFLSQSPIRAVNSRKPPEPLMVIPTSEARTDTTAETTCPTILNMAKTPSKVRRRLFAVVSLRMRFSVKSRNLTVRSYSCWAVAAGKISLNAWPIGLRTLSSPSNMFPKPSIATSLPPRSFHSLSN